jgi:hypothetical protein
VRIPTIVLFKSALPITSRQLPTTTTSITISNIIASYPPPSTWSPITNIIAIFGILSLFSGATTNAVSSLWVSRMVPRHYILLPVYHSLM